jgi:NADP-dependent 3-hydroxy acid dehydrogenase YdfG
MFDHTVATNLKGVWLCMKYEILQMLKQGGGALVNCASVAGLVGSPVGIAYVASKHGVVPTTSRGKIRDGKGAYSLPTPWEGLARLKRWPTS